MTSRCSVSAGSSPMSATTTSPAWKRPGATARPTFQPCIVTVTSARTAAPSISPVSAFTPEGRSTATTGTLRAFTASISSAASRRGSPRKPVPNSPSIRTSPSRPSWARRPAACNTSSAIRASPPFAPPPQTAPNERASGNRRNASSATARPARSISAGTSCQIGFRGFIWVAA